ncbi:unnamed protein product [Euphydryas editha]|uniref:Uncharacterized protein n=1 Tax=Euphydryas editha TaxID=104508 RepID=A0AAU9UN55_EUPED|nr:unnamed protein product [Euphydryas editha]
MELEEICPYIVLTENICINKDTASERKNVNKENNNDTNYVNEENMDETINEPERIMGDANNEAEENMDETKNKTEGNMDRVTNGTEGIMNNANNETTGNMDEANMVNVFIYRNTGEAPKGTTKSGNPRLRRKYEESLDTGNENKKRLKIEKMSIKPGCNGETCRNKYFSSFTESERENINKLFWELKYEAQEMYIKSLLIVKEVNRRIKESSQIRKHTYSYFLEIENKKEEVSKIFFLTTLGYAEKNYRRVLDILKKPLNAQADQRSKREHTKKVNREQLKEHIESFRLAIGR